MILLEFTRKLGRLVDIRPGEAARVGMLVSIFFFIIAANNLIKVVRDSLFLSRFPITQLKSKNASRIQNAITLEIMKALERSIKL